jgi:hypothetical protein
MAQLTKLLLFLILFLLAGSIYSAHAFPSATFSQTNGDWYDSFGIDRNNYGGSNGYLPNLASETLWSNKELAYSIGESLRNMHGDKVETAKAILQYVQTWTVYGYDNENVFRDNVAQDEWAWNADEMSHAFNEETGVKATGDCEDLSFLCATIYTGAGIDAAVVDAPGHVACLIFLPEYQNANQYWELTNDNHGSGWIWVEATGKSNPLGWTPPDFSNGDWTAYPLEASATSFQQTQPKQSYQVQSVSTEIIIVVIFAVLVLIALVVAVKIKNR